MTQKAHVMDGPKLSRLRSGSGEQTHTFTLRVIDAASRPVSEPMQFVNGPAQIALVAAPNHDVIRIPRERNAESLKLTV